MAQEHPYLRRTTNRKPSIPHARDGGLFTATE